MGWTEQNVPQTPKKPLRLTRGARSAKKKSRKRPGPLGAHRGGGTRKKHKFVGKTLGPEREKYAPGK